MTNPYDIPLNVVPTLNPSASLRFGARGETEADMSYKVREEEEEGRSWAPNPFTLVT